MSSVAAVIGALRVICSVGGITLTDIIHMTYAILTLSWLFLESADFGRAFGTSNNCLKGKKKLILFIHLCMKRNKLKFQKSNTCHQMKVILSSKDYEIGLKPFRHLKKNFDIALVFASDNYPIRSMKISNFQ